MEIYYDSIQEGLWFQELHHRFKKAELLPFPPKSSGPPKIIQALSFDRPDIILSENHNPILILERTIEVPTGHNVGQRFARLVAGAQMTVPLVYLGPYAAYKHGGATQGPRYMNLRLFHSLKKLALIENTVITIINWEVDQNYEIIQDPKLRDKRIKEYLELFLNVHNVTKNTSSLIKSIKSSKFEVEQNEERQNFISREITSPEQYDKPPESVIIKPANQIEVLIKEKPKNIKCKEVVFYKVGMKYIRSDPYTGMSLLYSYLYCDGLKKRVRNLILYFPNITKQMWVEVANSGRERKDIRLYKLAADGILFSNGYLTKEEL